MNGKLVYDPKSGRPYLHPGRQADIFYEGDRVGFLGEVHPEVLDNYDIGEKTYVAVIDLPKIVERATFERKYEGIAKYPAVSRDLAMVVRKELLVGDIEEVMEAKAGDILESLGVFDVYEGDLIQSGFKSVAFYLVFRAKDHTLTDEEITRAMDNVLAGLSEMGIELRR